MLLCSKNGSPNHYVTGIREGTTTKPVRSIN